MRGDPRRRAVFADATKPVDWAYSDGYGRERCVTEREGPGKRGPSWPKSNAGGASAAFA